MSFAFASPTTVLVKARPTVRGLRCARHPTPQLQPLLRRTAIMCDAAPVDAPVAPVETAVADGTRGILMLCLGNICRSPAAEAVLKGVLKTRNLEDKFTVDSCGTGGGSPDWYMDGGHSHHVGADPDVRMSFAAKQRGISIETASRPLAKEDFDQFEYIVAMDSDNVEAVETARQHWGVEEPKAKVVLMNDFSSTDAVRGQPVPDPYYGGQNGFDRALDMIQDSCEGLVDHLTKE